VTFNIGGYCEHVTSDKAHESKAENGCTRTQLLCHQMLKNIYLLHVSK